MQKEIELEVNKKTKSWRKMDRIRTILMNNENLSYDEATKKASGLVKKAEFSRIQADNEYMIKHWESLKDPVSKDYFDIFGVSN